MIYNIFYIIYYIIRSFVLLPDLIFFNIDYKISLKYLRYNLYHFNPIFKDFVKLPGTSGMTMYFGVFS